MNRRKKWGVTLVLFLFFSVLSYTKVVFSLTDEWVYGGITVHDNTYNMNTKLQSYYEYQVATNQLWKVGYAQVRDTLNWDVLLSQLYEYPDTPYKAGLVEGAWGSYMVKGYYFGPAINYTMNTYWTFLFYGGLYIVTTPYGKTNGQVNINPQYGNATLNKITYNLMPSLGGSVRYLFDGLGI